MMISDLDQVIEIERDSFSEPWTRRSFEHEMLADSSEVTVAVSGSTVLGYTVAWLLGAEVHLANVAVRKGYRERGIGKALMENVLDRARREGATRVLLEVRRSNAEARKLYEGLGFQQVGVRRNYYRVEVEDAILMECRLRRAAGGDTGGEGTGA